MLFQTYLGKHLAQLLCNNSEGLSLIQDTLPFARQFQTVFCYKLERKCYDILKSLVNPPSSVQHHFQLSVPWLSANFLRLKNLVPAGLTRSMSSLCY